MLICCQFVSKMMLSGKLLYVCEVRTLVLVLSVNLILISNRAYYMKYATFYRSISIMKAFKLLFLTMYKLCM